MQNGSLYNIYLHDECNICVCTCAHCAWMFKHIQSWLKILYYTLTAVKGKKDNKQLSTVKYQTASAATYQDSVQQRQRLVSYKLQEPRYCWRNILLFVWLVQRPNILQCFLTGKIPLLHYTINDDVQRDSFGFQSFQSLLLHCFMMFKEIVSVFWLLVISKSIIASPCIKWWCFGLEKIPSIFWWSISFKL